MISDWLHADNSNWPGSQFEYQILDDKDGINPDSVEELNYLGAQGWELVAIGRSRSQYGGNRYYFKRQKLTTEQNDA